MDKLPIQQKGTLVPVIAEIVSNFFKLGIDPEPRSLAERYLNLSELKGYIEQLMDASKPALVEANVCELFPEFDLRVQRVEGVSRSAINTMELFNGLAIQNRTGDFFKVCSVSQKALTETLPDGEALIAKYKEVGEPGDPYIKVSAMTKAEWAKLQAKDGQK